MRHTGQTDRTPAEAPLAAITELHRIRDDGKLLTQAWSQDHRQTDFTCELLGPELGDLARFSEPIGVHRALVLRLEVCLPVSPFPQLSNGFKNQSTGV